MKIKFILFATVLISILISCEKDEEKYSSTLKNTHRIKQIVQIDRGEFDVLKSVYLYEGEKLVKVIYNEIDESGNWNETDKNEIIYSGNNASATRYYKESDNWKIL